MNRHEQRVIAMKSIYQNLLLGKDIRRAVYDLTQGQNEVDEFLYALTIELIDNKDAYIMQINQSLREDWTFDRLSLLEQSILLISYQELKQVKTARAVVINEAITLAKEYCDDSSYKLINGVLDRL
ncbi:N utilization substance protein B [Faecalicoccus acidiformans]|uniref:N utilization substance protein B n=1 Tax=Faecalicoccus acidiformans TaxID=915173 RepID=A0A7W8D154_9FIRM|nr:transcription antitermination factor NusB [Faecalicoccus acidiformans]MBB5185322.1 N utilization substance protein B [Faecalicoccus acidiformans]MDM8203906.1 transcription antitermination factor NusB [Faecalicoccus acidiformans]